MFKFTRILFSQVCTIPHILLSSLFQLFATVAQTYVQVLFITSSKNAHHNFKQMQNSYSEDCDLRPTLLDMKFRYIDKTSWDKTYSGTKRPETKHPETKRTMDKTSFGHNVQWDKTSSGTKRPRRQNILKTKHPAGQNVLRDKTSSETKRPNTIFFFLSYIH
jgi:hypothetical protein